MFGFRKPRAVLQYEYTKDVFRMTRCWFEKKNIGIPKIKSQKKKDIHSFSIFIACMGLLYVIGNSDTTIMIPYLVFSIGK